MADPTPFVVHVGAAWVQVTPPQGARESLFVALADNPAHAVEPHPTARSARDPRTRRAGGARAWQRRG